MNKPPEQKLRWRKVSPVAFGSLAAFLILPGLAVVRLSAFCDLRLLLGYAGLISLVAFFVYRHDKRQATSQGWRTPESTLHLLEFLGGWPGAFLAQRILRHKSSKVSYQIAFWGIIAAYQLVSFDFLQDWHYSKALSSFVLPKA